MSTASAVRGDRMRRALAGAVAIALAGVALPAASASAAPGPTMGSTVPARPRFPAVEDLYDPGVLARHAFVDRAFTPRVAPSMSARSAGAKLRLLTEDRTTELVLVLARTADADGRTWLRVRTPGRPNGSVGWVPGDVLGTMRRVATWVQVDLRRTTLTLVRSGTVVLRVRVGVGKPGSPTPTGEFYVRNELSGRTLGAIYGPVAFGLSAHSDVLTDWPGGGVVGIHGTDRPDLLPGAVSHGCIRLRNADVLRLARLLPIGTPVTIR
ncbi:L,D-transpeptidase [Patulibacter minatonensis]|uniref:L,D-transpeptidase n=1 Tax=Patulibacter minatonensis TaxID=298163 RepID=UPI00047A06B8|nr:L,D-transpeptidase [Patulibacter minatonensis]